MIKSKKYKLFNIFNSNFFNFTKNLETNKLFIGIMMIVMNISSRFIDFHFTKTQERIIKSVARELFIFVVAFIGTKDLLSAVIITGVFIILANYLFNENCNFNIIPKRYKNVISEMDFDSDGKISKEEIKKAEEILKKAKENDKIKHKINMINYI
jgi:uncharacterized membrane protein